MISIYNLFNPTRRNVLPVIKDDLLLKPGHKLSQQIKLGQLTSRKVVSAYIERIRQVNPYINAMAGQRFDEALKEADEIDIRLAKCRQQQTSSNETTNQIDDPLWYQPLAGIPMSVKESIAVKGLVWSCGMWNRRDQCSERDADAVDNARQHGLIPIITTNVPEATFYWADCENAVYGRTLNPYDLSRVPGGSSGGEGAILGAGASVVGIGSDMGGSLRFPAHFCGIYSHKPTPYTVSAIGNWPPADGHLLKMLTFGPMTRYASDLKHMFKSILPLSNGSDGKQSEIEQKLRLDEPVDLSKLTIYYYDFEESNGWTKSIVGDYWCQISPTIKQNYIDNVVKHFSDQFNCPIKTINLSEYYKGATTQWLMMLRSEANCGSNKDILGWIGSVGNLKWEFFKLSMGLSHHTLITLAGIMTLRSGSKRDPEKSRKFYEESMKAVESKVKRFAETLGLNGVLIIPTCSNVAMKYRESLVNQQEILLPTVFNLLQCPATHAHYALDQTTGMPYGFTIAAMANNDRLTLAVAEEIERKFGGWTAP